MACTLHGFDSSHCCRSGCQDRSADPSMRTLGGEVIGGRWGRSVVGRSPLRLLAVGGVAVLKCCTALAWPVAGTARSRGL